MPTEGSPRGGEVAGPAALGLTALGLVVCCGLPVLLSIGAGITIAGIGLRSGLLGLAGLIVVVAAGVWRHRRRARFAMPCGERRKG